MLAGTDSGDAYTSRNMRRCSEMRGLWKRRSIRFRIRRSSCFSRRN